jgi:hypothetical protein
MVLDSHRLFANLAHPSIGNASRLSAASAAGVFFSRNIPT